MSKFKTYKKEYADELLKFYDKEEAYYWDEKAKKYMPHRIPSLLRFAKHIGRPYRTVKYWLKAGRKKDADKNIKKFSDNYKICKVMLRDHIVHLGISGVIPTGAYVFTAINYTKMRSKQETDLTSGGNPISLVALHEKIENVGA